MPRIHLLIAGRVQGVFFRMHTHKKATQLKLTGWVRNLPDGRVEAYAEGEENLLEEFAEWCHQGPPAAQVEKVDVKWEEGENKFKDFRIIQ